MSTPIPALVPKQPPNTGVAVIDITPACTIERWVQFAARITLLFAVLDFSSALYSLVRGKLSESGTTLGAVFLLALVYILIGGGSKFLKNRWLFFFLMSAVLLFYTLVAIALTMTSFPVALFAWAVVVLLLFTTIRAVRAIWRGGLRVYAAGASYQRKWARNGSHFHFALFHGLVETFARFFAQPSARKHFFDDGRNNVGVARLVVFRVFVDVVNHVCENIEADDVRRAESG